MATPTFTKTGTKASTAVSLDKKVFAVEVPNHQLLKDAYVAYLSNGRVNLAVTKTRGEVRGGGKKPWKQKGTGKARFGSSRVPIWRGGGITFGPTGNENYAKKLNVKAKRVATRQALTLASTANKISVVESFDISDSKTKTAAALLAKLGARRRTLLVVDNKDMSLVRATRNLTDLIVVQAKYVNVYDVLNADTIIITKHALQIISDWLAVEPKAPVKEAK
jgi:large subunit ribosomal protein L4